MSNVKRALTRTGLVTATRAHIHVASNTSLHADELKKLECPPKP